jgi:hypothetical protein
MVEIEEITSAITWYMSASANLAKCLEDCDVSPGYHCQSYYAEQEKARDELADKLNKYIDERIALALQKAG